MPELGDLYTVGDDEDVAALSLYRHLHERRCGHCSPPIILNSEAAPVFYAVEAASRWIGLFSGRGAVKLLLQ
jgi:hypothetical protein